MKKPPHSHKEDCDVDNYFIFLGDDRLWTESNAAI